MIFTTTLGLTDEMIALSRQASEAGSALSAIKEAARSYQGQVAALRRDSGEETSRIEQLLAEMKSLIDAAVIDQVSAAPACSPCLAWLHVIY